jgi:hypothetical protein
VTLTASPTRTDLESASESEDPERRRAAVMRPGPGLTVASASVRRHDPSHGVHGLGLGRRGAAAAVAPCPAGH